MSHSILEFCFFASIIIVAGVFLAKSADKIAEVTGVGRILVGSILLAGATSLPEFMVDLSAIKANQPDLAVGDLLGSNLFNLFILAVVDTAFRHPRRAFSHDSIDHAQNAVLGINLCALAGVAIISGFSFQIAGISIFSWIILGVYFIGFRLSFETPPGTAEKILEKSILKKLLAPTLGFLAAAAVILVVAPFLVSAADKIATTSGLGHTFVGTTLIALSTSLPELVATIAAFRLGAPDLALGNIFGSNTFNMVLFFPLDLYYQGDLFASVRPIHALTAFAVIVVSSVAVIGQLMRKRKKHHFWEPSSELVILLSLAFLFLLYRAR